MALDRAQAEALFTANLSTIDRILGALSRRHGLRGDDADDFASWATLRLIEDDYAPIRKFRGEASIGSYLTVVLAMMLREYRVKNWGRWRPSAAALRAGAVAVRLETLTVRDGVPFAQAAETLRTSGETTLSDRQLAAMASAFPTRNPARSAPVDPSILDEQASAMRADDIVESELALRERDTANQALQTAIGELPPEDRLIMRLRFWNGMSVPEIARATGLDQKPIYRRIERTLGVLRSRLEALGVSDAPLGALTAEPTC
jgi:RNA polymerase sigma factor for flagellar operon FliA